MFSLYKTGFTVFSFIDRAVRRSLRLGHVNVKKLLDDR